MTPAACRPFRLPPKPAGLFLAQVLARAAVSIGLLAGTPYAEAEGGPAPCAARKEIVARLAERYGETLQSVGLDRNNAMLEVYASEAGSWTILVTNPEGLACLVASGQMWEPQAAPLPGKEA